MIDTLRVAGIGDRVRRWGELQVGEVVAFEHLLGGGEPRRIRLVVRWPERPVEKVAPEMVEVID